MADWYEDAQAIYHCLESNNEMALGYAITAGSRAMDDVI
jgi:hypothetical protein